MEDVNRMPPGTESPQSPVGEVAGAGRSVLEDPSTECSQQQKVPAKGSEGKESTPPGEDTLRREQQEADVDEDKSGTSTKGSTGKGDAGSSSSKGRHLLSSTGLAEAHDSATDDVPVEYGKRRNTFAEMDKCMELVEQGYKYLEEFHKEVLDKLKIKEHECIPRDYECTSESSLFLERLEAVKSYLDTAYRSFAAEKYISGGPQQHVKKAAVGESAGTSAEGGEDTTERKKIKLDSDVSTEALKAEKLVVIQRVEKSEETAVVCPEGYGASSMVQKELGDAPPDVTSGEKAIEAKESAVQMPTAGTFSSATFSGSLSNTTASGSEVPVASRDVETGSVVVRTSPKVITRQLAALHAIKMKLACDFLLTSAKCVYCVVGFALKSHALCPLLLKVAKTDLDEKNLETVKHSTNSATQYTGFAVEAVEAAVQYHKSAVSNFMDVEVQVHGKLKQEVLSQVIKAGEEIETVVWQRPAVSTEEIAEKLLKVAEEMAPMLSPALKLVKDASLVTEDVDAKLDTALLHKAMAATLTGATGYTLFVISQVNRVLGILSESNEGTRAVEPAQDEAGGSGVPQDEKTVQGSATP